MLPFAVSRSCAPIDVLVGPRMCSPEVNSTLSTESDRFSGHGSSHPSSFQVPCSRGLNSPSLFPNSPNFAMSRSRAFNQLDQQMWIGYDGPLTNGDASHLLVVPESRPDDIKILQQNGSSESLIEPPDSFKNKTNEVVPPEMPPLKIGGNGKSGLTQSCNWGWQGQGISYH